MLIRHKLDYLTRTAQKFSAGKDIRLYHIAHWFRGLFEQLGNAYAALLRKWVRQETTSDGLIAFFVLVRDSVAYARADCAGAAGADHALRFCALFWAGYRFFRLDAWAGQAGKRAAPCKPGVQ